MSYIETDDDGQIVRVTCKLCGATLQAYTYDPRVPPTVRKLPDGTVIHEQAYRLRPTALYTEVTLEVEEPDGTTTQHVTPLCRNCAAHITDADTAEILRQDIAQWRAEMGQHTEYPAVAAFLAQQARRKPRGIVKRA